MVIMGPIILKLVQVDSILVILLRVAFCTEIISLTQHGEYQWNRTAADLSLSLPCQYGGVNISDAMVYRQCGERGIWEPIVYDQCFTYTESVLRYVTSVSSNSFSYA